MRRWIFFGFLLLGVTWACSDDQSVNVDQAAPVITGSDGNSNALNVDLDQWANGTDTKDPEWQNGNLNGNNSTYAELRVVPFRLAIEGLDPGTHTIHINYDFTAGGRKAYDFLASVDASEALSSTGYASVEDWLCAFGGGAVSSLCSSEGGPGLGSYDAEVFPYDAFNATPYLSFARQVGGGVGGLLAPGTIDGTPTAVQLSGLTDEQRQLRIYGGTITDISLPTHDGPLDGNSEADMVVEFTTTGSAVLMVWGGQLSCSLCWESLLGGELNGASQISGAPWHMRTQNLDAGGASNEDRSIQPSAVVPPGRVDGFKYHDLNANGTRDEGEPGLENWEIRLAFGTEQLTTTTDETGYFAFEALPPGMYDLSEVCPVNGWMQSEPVPTDGCGSGVYTGLMVVGEETTSVNFGNYEQSVKAGHKWHDLDADGVWDEGEPPLEGWTIQAWQGETLVASTTTATDGSYSFSLEPGSYTIREVCGEGWLQSAPAPTDGCGCGVYDVTVVSELLDSDLDFGNYQLASGSGSKFHDLDADGVWDEGEPGLENWTIRVTGTDGMGNAVDVSTTTDANGDYSAQLTPGTYTMAEECPVSGWMQSLPTPTNGCGSGVYDVTLTSGQVAEDYDFGNYELASKSGVKYHDVGNDGDTDGLPDAEDTPLDGFTIQLYSDVDGSGTLNSGDAMLASTMTGLDGAYSFTDLAPGDYIVCEVTLSSWILSYPDNTVCGDGMGGIESGGWAFSLQSGENEVGNHFFNTGEIYGCTPGYWKNHTDRWVGYTASDPLSAAFDAGNLTPYASETMLAALDFPGGNGIPGAKRILLRAAVASLLNFAHPDVAFTVPQDGSLAAISTETGLKLAVDVALASNDRAQMLALATQLDDANNAINMCPLEGTRAYRP